jgi:hypothetical protein
MAVKRRTRSQYAAEFITGGDINMSMYWFGDLNLWGSFPTEPTIYQRPKPQIFYMARNWFERQIFLRSITQLKFDLYNYGFKLGYSGPQGTTAAEKKEFAKKNDAIAAWHENNKSDVMKLVRDTWQEWLTMDNAIAVWSKDLPPVIYPIEHLTYTDEFGIEELRFAHGLSPQAIDMVPNISKKVRQALADSKTVAIVKQGETYNGNNLFQFEALKRTRIGAGLAWPQIRGLFNTVITWEALELADSQLADAMRTVYELHKVGHEIKNGPRAGYPDHFLKKKRALAIDELIKNKRQFQATIKKLVVNFDHEISYPRPDSKLFGGDRYEAALERLMYFAMPIAQMLFAKQVNPWHGNFLKAKAATERGYIGPFLDNILQNCLRAPKGTTCTWSDDMFTQPQQMMDTLKAGLASGPLSQQTFMEKAPGGPFNVHMERQRKDDEGDLEDHIVQPAFDAAHGLQDEAGRPPGAGDKRKRKASR